MNPITNGIVNWLSPTVLQSLGWALVHFLWQGTALAALAAALMALSRRTQVRYAFGVATLTLMLLAPAGTFVRSLWQHSRPEVAIGGVMPSTNPANDHAIPSSVTAPLHIPAAISRTSSKTLPGPLQAWLVQAWLAGVAIFGLRTAGGFILLARRRKQSHQVGERLLDICYTLQDRLGITTAVEFCESAWLEAPAVIGWFRPIVFLPMTALSGLSEEQLESVIAHELAHIKRLDPFVNVFQVCVETLLFYHPAVWWLNKRIRTEREVCCDETAIELCGDPVNYARALTLMEQWRTAPSLAMAANRGPLSERILRVLGLKTTGGMRSVGFSGGLLCLAAALLAGNVLIQLTHPRAVRAGMLMQALVLPASSTAQQPSAKPEPASKPSAAESPRAEASANSNSASSSSATSYIDQMKAAGIANPTIDELIALKVQDVTPEYVRKMRDLGLHPDVDNLVSMKVQGVSPEYIQELRGLGFKPDADEIVAFKVQGVTADYVRGLKEAGIQGDSDQIVGLKVQGVTPEYVRQLKAAGLKLDADEVVGLKVQGVTPEYVKGLRDQGLNPDTDEVIGMKVQSITPEYLRDIRALGLNPSADDLIGMKVQGVTPEYIKAMQAAGFKPSVDDVIDVKVQGVTPEFIEMARKHGFQNLTIEKLIELKRLGVLEDKATL